MLVNNAALFLRRGCDAATAEDWSRIMGTNVAGTALCSRDSAEAMRDLGRGGAIVVVSSMNGIRADRGYATVSRTINGTCYVNPQTAERVWLAVKELDYHPNIYATALASGRSQTLGLIVSDIVNPFFPELVKSFDEVATERGYEVFLTNTNDSPARMKMLVKRFIERKVEGVAVMTSKMDAALVGELEAKNIPFVFLDGSEVKDRVSNIKIDYAGGMTEAAEHLLALGHTRIGFISGPDSVRSASWRRDCFLDHLRSRGIKPDTELIEHGNHKLDGGRQAMERLLALKRPPTAIVGSNDLTAIGAIQAVRSVKLKVPENISVIGFDVIEVTQYTDPPLTTIRLSRLQIAEQAFEALMNHIDAEQIEGTEYVAATRLVVRQSTAARRAR